MTLPLCPIALVFLAPFAVQDDEGWRATFDRHVHDGDLYQAVGFLEDYLHEEPDDVEAWRVHARGIERLVAEAGARWDVLDEAKYSWDHVIELAPHDLEARRAAVDVRMRVGDWEEAAILARESIGTALLLEGEVPSDLVGLACRATVAAHVEGEFDDLAARDADLARTWATVENARAWDPGNVELWSSRASLLDWLGLPERAVDSLVEAIEAHPGEAALHRTLIDLHVREGIEERLPGLYAGLAADPGDATFAWYTGYVARVAGDLAERERRFELALDLFGQCEDWMQRTAALEPAFSLTCEQVRIQARVATAWCHIEADEADVAEALLRETFADTSEHCRHRDGLGRTAIDALAAIGDRHVAANDYRRGSDLARFVVRLVPDDGAWWNNLAFFLREYGTQLEVGAIPDMADAEAAAKDVLRESWNAYLMAVELMPGEPFLPNDASILQIYHLQEELAAAERLCLQAIAIGEGRLEDLGPDADERERFPVLQAMGDAYQNLGYLYYHVYERPQEARPFWVKCKETGGGDRSYADDYLDAIDGRTDPVPLRDDTAIIQPPRSREDEPADAPRARWSGSLEEARRRAREEGTCLLFHNHGHGLGLRIPVWDDYVNSSPFAEATEGAVLVVGDALRHTFVDRRRDGTRVLCPRWRTIPCADHLQAHEEFVAWFTQRNGTEPGQPEEGLWHLGPGAGDELSLLTASTALPELVPHAGGERWRDLGVEPLSLTELEQVCRELLAHPSFAAREKVEELLFGSTTPGDVRLALVGAIAADERESSRTLLAALVRQEGSPLLAEAALRKWPAGRDLAPVSFAARWSADGVVRDLARAILAREEPGFGPREAARRIVDAR